ncbi:MAG: hypothetical protein ACE5KF_06730 [Kiloniellaceae bacterium]
MPAASADDGTKPAVRLYPALVDTGAAISCISPRIAQEVGLQPIGKRQMVSATHIADVNTYLADVLLPFGDPNTPTLTAVSQSMTLMEFQPSQAPYQALMGRDIICSGFLSVAGYDKRFTFCM